MIATFDESKTFTPVTIHLTCETQDELNALGTLFACTGVISTLWEFTPDKSVNPTSGGMKEIYLAFKNAGASIYQAGKMIASLKRHLR